MTDVLDPRRLVDPKLLPVLDSVSFVELNAETVPLVRNAESAAGILPEAPGALEAVATERRSAPGLNGAPTRAA